MRREYLKEWRKRNPDKVKEYRQKYRERHKLYSAKHKAKYPERTKARLHARYLPLDDKCAKCGSDENLVHHHPDYSQPDMTVTLCLRCHQDIHRG